MTPPPLPHPALVAGHARAVLLTADGELLTLAPDAARSALRANGPPLVVHLPETARRLGLAGFPALDLLELFAFACPARHAAPTPRGLALALGLPVPPDAEAEAILLPVLADHLLSLLHATRRTPSGRHAASLATLLAGAGWSWSRSVLTALAGNGDGSGGERIAPGADALAVWRRLPVWEEAAPRPPPAAHDVSADDSRRRLAFLLGADAEPRPGQSDYAHAAAAAFAPRHAPGDPVLLLAEAGTGTGKTLGYLAPATLWAERNNGAVLISTFTRHLQRQIEREIGTRLAPDPLARDRRRVVVRKGRENYLCLLNYEDAVRAARTGGAGVAAAVIPLALVARWALATSDGDIAGGDLPGWFRDLFGAPLVASLADRRGECIHGACPHYGTCFVEHSIRRAREAALVIANHALVMVEAAHARDPENRDRAAPSRLVFDEGHHLADAADAAFSVALSGAESAELRRWLLGAEGARSRARGLRRRLDDLVAGAPALEAPLDAALLAAAQALAAPGWSQRLAVGRGGPPSPPPSGADAASPANPTEALLAVLRAQVLARDTARNDAGTRGLGIDRGECDLHPLGPGVAMAAERLGRALERIRAPLATVVERLAARLDTEADTLDTVTRGRIEAMCRVVRRRALDRLSAWIAMLQVPAEPPPEPGARPSHVHFLRLHDRGRDGGRGADVAFCRHFLDPTLPFALTVAVDAHGLLVTSATLRDETGLAPGADPEQGWLAAEARVGASHLPSPALRASLPSPFDYGRQTLCLLVNDLAPGAPDALAAAYRTLFLAAGGGGLGLFTAISRLRDTHARIAAPLEGAGIPLLAQHVDAMDNATLVDIFRAERNSCLLGTDAMRDGVDVPGAALRLVVFERVPWKRPDILHRERRLHLSGGDPAGYDDRVVRLRLRQAFGRLVRSATDRGVFALLDRRMPSRLLGAFPPGVVPRRVGLAEAAALTRDFLA